MLASLCYVCSAVGLLQSTALSIINIAYAVVDAPHRTPMNPRMLGMWRVIRQQSALKVKKALMLEYWLGAPPNIACKRHKSTRELLSPPTSHTVGK